MVRDHPWFGVGPNMVPCVYPKYRTALAVDPPGASTLPPELFGQFPDNDCAEIHLVTDFQKMVCDHPALPLPLAHTLKANPCRA